MHERRGFCLFFYGATAPRPAVFREKKPGTDTQKLAVWWFIVFRPWTVPGAGEMKSNEL